MSKNYSFVKTPEEIEAGRNSDSKYRLKKVLGFSWLIEESTYRMILPPGLEPTIPLCYAFIADFPHAGFCLPAYAEGAVFITCAYEGVPGVYCLSMPIDGPNEMGILLGRENYGYPKKAAKVKLTRRGDDVYGSIERNGVKFFEVKATIGAMNDGSTETDTKLKEESAGFVYLLDFKLVSDGIDQPFCKGLRYDFVRLYRQKNVDFVYSSEPCSVELKFEASEDDPWIELQPVSIIGGTYNIMDTEMFGTQLVKTYTEDEYEQVMPYLYVRYDTNVLGKKLEFINV